MFFYYFQVVAAGIAVPVILVAAFAVMRDSRHASTRLQFIGAAIWFAVQVMSYLPLIHFEGRHLTPAWLWRAEEALGGAAALVFAVGYCWYYFAVVRRKNSRSDSVM